MPDTPRKAAFRVPERVPILMYHKVGAPVTHDADRFLNLPAVRFAHQMRLLQRLRYQPITLSEAVTGLFAGATLPPRPVCITFDDGYRNVLQNAAPILRPLGWQATVFVPTAHVGGTNGWDEGSDHPLVPLMDWTELRTLSEAGWEMAGHTRTHPALNTLDDAAARTEMEDGKRDLRERLGIEARTFCYPYGGVNARTPQLVQQAGFLGACTTKSGVANVQHNPFLLPRVKIGYRDGAAGFLYRLLIRPYLP